MRGGKLQHADEVILIVQRRHHDIAYTLLDEVVLDSRTMRVRGQVLDEQQLALGDGPFVDGIGKVCDARLRRIGTDSAVLKLRPDVQHEDLGSLNRRQAEAQIRFAEQGAQLAFQPVEAGF